MAGLCRRPVDVPGVADGGRRAMKFASYQQRKVSCLTEYRRTSSSNMDIQPLNSHYSGLLIGVIVLLATAVTETEQQDTFYFDPSPVDQDVVEGDDVLLQCDVSDRRHIQFMWEVNDRELQATARMFLEDSDLRVLRVDRSMVTNRFRCTATNITSGVSRRSSEAKLNILWIDQEARTDLKQPRLAELEEGKDVTIKCEVEGNSSPSIEWFKNKNRLIRGDRYRYLKNGKLKVISISVEDNGVYSCKAQNLAGTVLSEDNFILNIPGQEAAHLDVSTFTRYTLARQGDRAYLHCQYEGALITEWYHGETLLTNTTDGKYKIFDNGTLAMVSLATEDAGSYQCIGLSERGPDQQFVSELQIAYLAKLTTSSFQPRPAPGRRPLVVPETKQLEVLCVAPDGLPTPTLSWVNKWGKVVPSTGRISADGGLLTLTDALQDDSGNYTCVAENTAGQSRRDVWLVVSVPPRWKQAGPRSDRVMEGKTLTFPCQYLGTPYPVTVITWKKGEFPIDLSHPRYKVNQERMSLTISSVHLIDEDDYVCVVNTTGHPPLTSTHAHLYVEKRLKFRPTPVSDRLELGSRSEVECHADARKPPIVKWQRQDLASFPEHIVDMGGLLVFNGVSYSDAGNYSCIAQTDEERINATITISVVVMPKFTVHPKNTTAYEGYAAILHCIAEGVPTPNIEWDKNNVLGGYNSDRFKELSNGSLYITEVYMDDVGKYGCTAGNSGGFQREEVYLHVARADGKSGIYGPSDPDQEKADNFNMMKTIIIAVCSAVAYLAIVIGLTVYCSLRMMRAKNLRKQRDSDAAAAAADKAENGAIPTEHTELMDKKERDSSIIKSDMDARSHVSGVSSHQSQSTHSHNSQASRGRSVDKLAFPRHQLQTLGMLGKGHYGDVFLAKAHQIREGEAETLVVIKSLLSREDHHHQEFRREIDIFSKLSHDNLAKLLGICCDMEPRFLITEYTDWGDLKQYLWASRKDNGRRLRALNIAQKTTMCSQVAIGMEHMSNNRIVHKDLAARNVLLSSTLDLKISSLGLCRDVYATEYFAFHQQLIPVRWMPPEAVLEDEYSAKSDVWAFGVFMWEVFTLGDLPMRERTDEEVLKGLKVGGQCQYELPLDCPQELYQLMLKCTADSPKDRPTFSQLVTAIGEVQVDSDV